MPSNVRALRPADLTPRMILETAHEAAEGKKICIVILVDDDDNLQMWGTFHSQSKWALASAYLHNFVQKRFDGLVGEI